MHRMLLGTLALLAATMAHASIPLLNYSCPTGISVHADQGGPVYINGKQAALKKFNENYYEASDGGVTISLTRNPDESMRISYNRKGVGHGICTDERGGGSNTASSTVGSASSSSPSPSSDSLSLHCRGSGFDNKTETKTEKDPNSATGYTVKNQSTREEYNGTLDVKISGGMAQIRLPKELLPKLNSADSQGWVALQEVQMTSSEITGKANLNPMNHPTVRIDRNNGDIVIKASSGTFQGECQKSSGDEQKF